MSDNTAPSSSTYLPPYSLDFGALGGLGLFLSQPVTVSGKTYYVVDVDRSGAMSAADSVSHNLLDFVFNAGLDTVDTQPAGPVAGVDDARTRVIGPYTLALPTGAELLALRNTLLAEDNNTWAANGLTFASSTLTGPNEHLAGTTTTIGSQADALSALVVLQVIYSPTSGDGWVLDGTPGPDVIIGSYGDYVASGGNGNDSLIGGNGNDSLIGGNGNDSLIGGNGNDSLIGGNGNDRVIGGNDSISGGLGDDKLVGNDGNDTLVGNGGNDTLEAGEGADVLMGGPGNDYLALGGNSYATSTKLADGGEGYDTLAYWWWWRDAPIVFTSTYQTGQQITPSGRVDTVINFEEMHFGGGGGNDLLTGDNKRNYIGMDAGNDTLRGGGGYDSFAYNIGQGVDFGNDVIVDFASFGNELLFRGLSIKSWSTSATSTTLLQGEIAIAIDSDKLGATVYLGADAISGSDLSVRIAGGAIASANFSYSNSTFAGGAQGALIFTPIGTAIADTFTGTVGNDRYAGQDGSDSLLGLDGNDTLIGNNGDDTLRGGLGDDYLYGNAGSDLLDGGEQRRLPWTSTTGDYDRLDYSASAGTTINLSTRTVVVAGETGTDTYNGIEEIQGARFKPDVVTGRTSQSAADLSLGGASTVYLYLRGGSDSVNVTPYGPQQAWSGGPIVAYNWSSTPVSVVYTGAVATVSYAANAMDGQVAGTDTLTNVQSLVGSALSDTFDLRQASYNHLGYATTIVRGANYVNTSYFTLLLGFGGNDTVLGNGEVTVDYSQVTGSRNGLGLTIDLSQNAAGGTGTASLSHLFRTNSGTNAYLGTLTYSGVRGVTGTPFADSMQGGGNDEFEFFQGGAGDDFIDGRSGFDRAEYSGDGAGPVQVNLAAGVVVTASQGTDTLRSIESVTGTRFGDLYDARGFVTGVSTTSNQGSQFRGFNEFRPGGGDDTILGNGNTRLNYENSVVAVEVNTGTGVADARIAADKLTPQYQTMGRDTFTGVSEVRGSSYDDVLTGGGQGRTTDSSGFEFFQGGPGNDTIDGRGGYDFSVYWASPSAISVDMRLATGQVQDGWKYTDAGTGTSYEWFDTLIGIENVQGSMFNDTAQGGASPFYFSGRRGADRVTAGTGYTEVQYDSDPAGVVVNLGGWVGATGTSITTGFTGSAKDGWGDMDLLQGVTGVEGSAFADQITGSSGNDVLDARGGNDTVDGGAGNDWAEYNQATMPVMLDLQRGLAMDDGQGGVDTLISIENAEGGWASDSLTGSTGDNILVGGAGNDTLDGASGTDVAKYAGRMVDFQWRQLTSDGIWEVKDLRGQSTFNTATGAWTTYEGTDVLKNIETLRFTDGDVSLTQVFNPINGTNGNDSLSGTTGADRIQGLDGDDTLSGLAGNDYLDGGLGNNRLIGGEGNDTLTGGSRGLSGPGGDNNIAYYASATGAITALFGSANGTSGSGTVTGNTSVGTDTLLRTDQVVGTAYADTFTVFNDWSGSQFRNGTHLEVQGGGGNDTITGNGSVRLRYTDATAGITVNFSETVAGSGTATGPGVGTDTFTGVLQVRGSDFDDLLVGGAGTQYFRPGRGNDTVDGGAGLDDRVDYSSAAEGVNVSLALTTAQTVSTNEGSDTLRNIEYATGSYFNDTLTGSAGNDTLAGQDGNDLLDGGTGQNFLHGGAGNDTITGSTRGLAGLDFNVASYNAATAGVTVTLGVDGTALGRVVGDASVGTDVLQRIDSVKGTDFADVMVATSTWAGSQFNGFGAVSYVGGFNEFRPGGGDDRISGNGLTRVSYVHEATEGITVIFNGPGSGTVQGGSMGTDTFTGVNQIRATAYADVLVGSDAAEVFRPEGGDDTVDGGGGRDRVDYRGAAEGVRVDLSMATPQVISVSQGTDLLINLEEVQGSYFNDTLTGDSGDNRFLGEAGNDSIDGGDGIDMAVFSGAFVDYKILPLAGPAVVVTDQRTGLVNDGVDTLTHVEWLRFSDKDVYVGQDRTFKQVDPAGTYLADTASDAAPASTKLVLSTLGLKAGDVLQLSRVGDYQAGSSLTDTSTGLVAVFRTASGYVAPAVYLGTTTNTQNSGRVTNINEDFEVASGGTQVVVPAEAVELWFSVKDIFYNDNTDPNNNFGVNIQRLSAVNGTDASDLLFATVNADRVFGGEGSDTMVGGAGDDQLYGGPGDDRFYGGPGNDTLDGGEQRRLPWRSTSGDFDRLDYSNSAGIQVDLGARTVQVTGESGTDVYRGIEEIQGSFNTKDVITGRPTDSMADLAEGGISMGLWLRGGNDEVTLKPLGYQQPWSDGVSVGYSWSVTAVQAVAIGGETKVSYVASGSQLAGQDRLVNVGILSDTNYGDLFDMRLLTTNQMGYITDPAKGKSYNTLVLGNGGNDTVLGNGQTNILLSSVNASSTGKGAVLDMLTGAANLSHLTGGAALGTLTFSGVRGLFGSKFDDTLLGGVDDDFETFRGESGNDFIDGRTGYDRADYRNALSAIKVKMAAGEVSSTSTGTDTLRSIEALRGTMFDDVYDARGFVGGPVSTTLNSGSFWTGINEFSPEGGNDTIYGNGATRLSYELSMVGVQVDLSQGWADAWLESDKLTVPYASMGRDVLSGVAEVRGSAMDDYLIGGGPGREKQTGHLEWFQGGAGNDVIDGKGGNDVAVYASSAEGVNVDMRLSTQQVINDGWGYSDTLYNISGIVGSALSDKVVAGSANLTFTGKAGGDFFVGGTALNEVDFSSDPAGVEVVLNAWVGIRGGLAAGYTGSARDGYGSVDMFSNVTAVEGSDYDDVIIGSAGDDWLDGRGGADVIDGGSGNDWVEYNQATGGVRVDLSQGKALDDGQAFGLGAWDAAVEVDRLFSIENVQGGAGNDSIVGDANNNQLMGLGGNDTLDGGSGHDVAVYRGNEADYTITQTGANVWEVSDLRARSTFQADTGTWTTNDGTDTVLNIETLRFADKDRSLTAAVLPPSVDSLGGLVYHWKNHALMSNVSVSLAEKAGSPGNTGSLPLYELRNIKITATGVTADLWVNLTTGAEYLELSLEVDERAQSTFVPSNNTLPEGWSAFSEMDKGALTYAAIGLTSMAAKSVMLGSLSVQGVNPSSLEPVKFVEGAAGDGAGGNTLAAYQLGLDQASTVTGTDGHYAIAGLDKASYDMQVSLDLTDAEKGTGAISAADALAALKIAVSRNPNSDLSPVSPYQFIAADVTGDGKVTAADALAILKMAVKRSDASPREWHFVNEEQDFWNESLNSGVGGLTVNRSNVVWDKNLVADVDGATTMNLVAVLKGDVNGSWLPSAGWTATSSNSVPKSHFTDLASDGLGPVYQWAVL